MQTGAFALPGQWPAACDEPAADRLVQDFRALGGAEADLTQMPHFLSMLRSLGGNSPYLSQLAIREPATLLSLMARGPDAVAADVLKSLGKLPPQAPRSVIAAKLRQAKRIIALLTGISDAGGIWPLEKVTATLSDLAEAALRVSLSHLLRAAHDKGRIGLRDPDRPELASGFTVLAMGKLGGRELNYSSDIDLILLYDRGSPIYTGHMPADGIGQFTTRMARDLVSLMQDRDAEGYVFRTDLRLRPDPSATPLAVSFDTAVTYYESLAQNWERSAMIKARPVAGDEALGLRFLEAVRPFVWRHGLDFAAMADIHAMKRRINARKAIPANDTSDAVAQIAGRDVKLGEGGIREIEFLIQTLQLVWGGRNPTVRVSSTLGALAALVRAGHLNADAAGDLSAAYRFLRQIEHRLQMINDRQVHSFPKAGRDLDRVACFLGYPDAAALATDYLGHISKVRRHYQAVFAYVPDPPVGDPPRPEFDLRQDDPDETFTVEALKTLGFQEPERIMATVRSWLAGHVRALRSMRARELMTTMVPAILTALSKQSAPDEAFKRFDRFITALPTGVQPLSLFQHNPALLERIAVVVGGAPRLAEHLARYPNALEGLISSEDHLSPKRMLETRVAGTKRLDDSIQIIRRAVKERDFLLAVATLDGRLDADAAGRHRTALADATLSVLIPRVLADFSTRFGEVEGGGLAVVAMGKAGGREMMLGSDLDLMLIYDHPPDVTESHGRRAVPSSQWFVRATQACIAALTAPGPEGQMYAVDMRLRPSGSQGPVAVSLSSFIRYHAEDAWTWERMALTRARVVTGPPMLRERIRRTIREAINRAGDPTKIRADATAMRARMLRDLPASGPWDVKLRPGGMVEVEFVAQVLQLIHARDIHTVLSPTTRTALRRLHGAGLLAEEDAGVLITADLVWRTIQGMLRATVGQIGREGLPPASADLLLRAVASAGIAAVDIPDLLLKLDELARRVRASFVKHVGVLNA
jgi:[glutamine synthetase] adenylyltransferase / [glutamine synthetase]-adenylyl-L-tyrosine phosphorylase